MPNQRSKGQKLITVPADEEFIRQVDEAYHLAGYSDRSKFVRDALVEKLESLGCKVPKSLAAAPSRSGVGGSPAHKKKVSSAVDAVKQEAAVVALRGVIRKTPKSGH